MTSIYMYEEKKTAFVEYIEKVLQDIIDTRKMFDRVNGDGTSTRVICQREYMDEMYDFYKSIIDHLGHNVSGLHTEDLIKLENLENEKRKLTEKKESFESGCDIDPEKDFEDVAHGEEMNSKTMADEIKKMKIEIREKKKKIDKKNIEKENKIEELRKKNNEKLKTLELRNNKRKAKPEKRHSERLKKKESA